ncbi:MAG TPA: undecaprenyldiphospho-muramoylpentapeptide beta-N-acetylglucosaminyltransferase [Xanthobacteraceae bacterium]|jgi:UDP-N-acetylglucosamine--N-acetylmuramyl-(pentapeptide) pyrophosphoryl-undecaprenol N-acetylglucosamine transferase|nr:undecaprenyldiphospho-muramoylpentapeptide beta-N-acetylglucosaminyltransferase [Xanthobacteraceae bacterium]
MAQAAPLVVVAAGGTGGHLFPAEALAVALGRRGVSVDLATDERAVLYGADFPARQTHIIASATVRGRDPLALARTALRLGGGTLQAWRLFGRLRPAAVIGFGGYPTIPPLLAAAWRRIPTLIHEQNGVMGRANRFLAPRVAAIATSFPGVLARDGALAAKATYTGNPVRPAVVEAAKLAFAAPGQSGLLRLLVFGGSQGARIMADVVPAAVERLPAAVRTRLALTQQARGEDLERVRAAYARIGIAAVVEPFFPDLPMRLAQSHLVVSRSGASTVAELAAIGRPAVLVPLPHALDQDQLANAAVLEKAGGAIRIDQAVFTPEKLATEIARIATEPERLALMAQGSRQAGALDAADRLAELVLRVAGLEARG